MGGGRIGADLLTGQSAYDDANRIASATLPNGVVSSYAYDNANRLTGISHVKGGTTLASVSYTVDAVGNRSDRTDLAGTQSYGYDNLYRLTSVTYPGPTTTTYSYDAFGNRTQMVDASGTTGYAYDDADRLTSVTPPSPAPVVSYTWDDNGNLTNRGSDSFSWDYEDWMLSATVGGTTWTYAYRGDGLRNSATTGGVTKTFTWDVNAGLPVILDDGAQYIYGTGLVAQVSGSNTYYYLADGLGSTMATTDASGNVVNSYTYDVYGKTTASTGTQANDFQFAGQQTDPTGLQYLRARYYDPETGIFIGSDPLSERNDWTANAFLYAGCRPTGASDPMGLRPVDGDGERSVSRAERICNDIAKEIWKAAGRVKVLEGKGTGRPQNQRGRDSLQGKVKQYRDNMESVKTQLAQWSRYGCDEVLGRGVSPDGIEELVAEYPKKAKEYEKTYKNISFWDSVKLILPGLLPVVD